MKSFSLREQQSVIKILKEPPKTKKKKKWSWQRITFIIVLIIIAYSVGKRIYEGTLEVNGEGHVVMKKQMVSFTEDIRLANIYIEEGQWINKGDTLFRYYIEADENSYSNLAIEASAPLEWVEKEKLRLLQLLKNNRLENQVNTNSITFLKSEIKKYQKIILLGATQYRNTVRMYEKQLNEAQLEEYKLKENEKILRQQLWSISQLGKKVVKTKWAKANTSRQSNYFIAPSDGLIGQINFQTNEVCYEKQEVLTIHQKNAIRIKGYYDPAQIKYLANGKVIKIRFPDGSKGKGVINNLFVSTYALPAEFQKKYEPVRRNLVANIIPLDEIEARKWMNFYKTDVEISSLKWELNW
ncbi:hypothetical protein EMN47_13905 [Prolixibacteraceae bacterium JC049]|nr:hypothetical protein [Prolixibacteraceae bacterium JC049]